VEFCGERLRRGVAVVAGAGGEGGEGEENGGWESRKVGLREWR